MKISLVVPCFNEQDTIPLFWRAISAHSIFSEYDIELIFIDDGSKDKTALVLEELKLAYPKNIKCLYFSRNFGKESALFAGIDYADGDVIIPIDVDLQHPLDVIPRMVEKYEAGFDVVLAKCQEKDAYNYFKRKTSQWFYKFHNNISSLKIEENVGDFRLMSREVIDAIKCLPERQLFMKGIYAWVGFSSTIIEYEIEKRAAGVSKFNGWKLWNLALEGITSFSTVPLRVWSYIGGVISLLSFLYGGYLIISKLFWGNPVPGYPSLMVAVLFLGGVQLIGIGVLGEYIGRIYLESKQRPRYILKRNSSRSPLNK
ncbi:glycosyltransferase family 2 protein [Actinobacillus equuli subsp. equuli]|uniref:glycosyltransferase family 2 protein n=1 Tax=Actinobacillus equuli TaxID=718 RepID=UPI0024424742|nr:glycosyltransferase family 2 protein [Actinobacillus equuli]WGE54979.1 glycosyltransferase family 2 protein [Actinobacillus equuli subsp. equuli]